MLRSFYIPAGGKKNPPAFHSKMREKKASTCWWHHSAAYHWWCHPSNQKLAFRCLEKKKKPEHTVPGVKLWGFGKWEQPRRPWRKAGRKQRSWSEGLVLSAASALRLLLEIYFLPATTESGELWVPKRNSPPNNFLSFNNMLYIHAGARRTQFFRLAPAGSVPLRGNWYSSVHL